jgi:hypothetical protein
MRGASLHCLSPAALLNPGLGRQLVKGRIDCIVIGVSQLDTPTAAAQQMHEQAARAEVQDGLQAPSTASCIRQAKHSSCIRIL